MSISALELKRNKLMTDAQGLLSTETVSIESRASAKLMLAEVDTIESDIADLRRIESHNAAQAEFVRSARPNATGGVEGDKTPEQRKKEFNGAFRQFARHGYASLNQEQRDLVTTSDTTGGALIPQAFEGVLHNALKYYGPTAQKVAQKVTDNKGIPMKISFGNDTANGLVLLGTEGTSSPAETDPAFRSAILGVDTVTGGLVKVSFQELEDSSFDLDSWLRTAFSVRYARGMEKAVTLGTDNAGTTLPSQGTGGLIGAATVGDVTASIAAGIGWADFSKAYATLDPAYINSNSTWVMSSTTRGFLVGLVDGFGRPFFTPDPSGANPFQQILGFDITINQAMPAYNTANAKSVLFGDLSQAYMLRTDGQPSVLRLNER